MTMYDYFITGVLYISLIGLLLLGIIVVACTLLCGIKLAIVAVKVALQGVVRRSK